MKNQTLAALIVFSLLLVGCATSGTDQMSNSSSAKYQNVRTISVSTFTCSDPLIAQEVKNGIIEELLGSYTVVLGEGADISVKGSISLTPSASVNTISEIKARILMDNMVTDSLTLLQSGGDGAATGSPEDMGKKIGTGINKLLSM